jgi:hypothetical protein
MKKREEECQSRNNSGTIVSRIVPIEQNEQKKEGKKSFPEEPERLSDEDFDQEIQQKIQKWKQGLSQEDLFFQTAPECYEGLLTKLPREGMTRQELSRWREETMERARKKFDDRMARERAEWMAQLERERGSDQEPRPTSAPRQRPAPRPSCSATPQPKESLGAYAERIEKSYVKLLSYTRPDLFSDSTKQSAEQPTAPRAEPSGMDDPFATVMKMIQSRMMMDLIKQVSENPIETLRKSLQAIRIG